MPEEKIDLVVRLDRGNDVKEDKEFNNVSSSWAEIDNLVLENDNTPEFWIIEKAYPGIRADKLVKIIEYYLSVTLRPPPERCRDTSSAGS